MYGDLGILVLSFYGIRFSAQITSARDQVDKGDYRTCGLRTHLRYKIRQIGPGSSIFGLIGHPSLFSLIEQNLENLGLFIAPGLLKENM